MGTVPTPGTWVDGERLTYDVMQARLTVVQNFLLNPPRVKVRKTSSFVLANNTATDISWSLSEVDTDNMWDVSNPTQIIPKTPGWYIGQVSVQMGLTSANPATGDRYVFAKKNNDGAGVNACFNRLPAPSTANKPMIYNDMPLFHYFNGTTDYLNVTINQSTGANLTVFASGNTTLDLRWFAE